MGSHAQSRIRRPKRTGLSFVSILFLAVLILSAPGLASAEDIPLDTSVPEQDPSFPPESY